MKDKRIENLPKWAQEYIEGLEREKYLSDKTLHEYLDNQKESPISVVDYVNGKFVTNYIQTHRIEVCHAGVFLCVLLRDNEIDLSWGSDRMRSAMVSFVPWSYQQAKLFSQNNMY